MLTLSPQPNRPITVLLDMDGVIVDFIRGFLELNKIDLKTVPVGKPKEITLLVSGDDHPFCKAVAALIGELRV